VVPFYFFLNRCPPLVLLVRPLPVPLVGPTAASEQCGSGKCGKGGLASAKRREKLSKNQKKNLLEQKYN
jgi:hypothetical protein